jgi:hypothetical protein
MKLTFGIITLNADFFIKQVLESIYPFAHKIIIADGPVKWWAENHPEECSTKVEYGHVNEVKITNYGSTDKTLGSIGFFPDPENKIITVVGGVYNEKDDQCRAWFKYVPTDTDYVICNDADEVHSPENLEKLIRFLESEQPTSVGFKSDSFFGGFDHIIGGFERDHSFKRVLKYVPGCFYRTHRQPTLAVSKTTSIHFDDNLKQPYTDIEGKDISGNQLYEATGITMWHGSYVSPRGVYNKIRYYEGAVISKGNCIPYYFKQLWLPWVLARELGDSHARQEIETRWNGVQEFMPHARGACFTEPYTGTHPPAIQASMPELIKKFNEELKQFL